MRGVWPSAPAALPPQDECQGWDVNELVFSPALWGTYQVRREGWRGMAGLPAKRRALVSAARMAAHGDCPPPSLALPPITACLHQSLLRRAAPHARRLHAL